MTVTNTLRSLAFFLGGLLLLYGSSLSGLPTHVFPCHLWEVSKDDSGGRDGGREEGGGHEAGSNASSFVSLFAGDGGHKLIR